MKRQDSVEHNFAEHNFVEHNFTEHSSVEHNSVEAEVDYNPAEPQVDEGSVVMQSVVVQSVTTDQERAALYEQRWFVLRKPLALERGTEQDQYDPEPQTCHFAASCSSQMVGSARFRQLSPTLGSIAYVAVLPEFQRRGIGTALVKYAIKIARQRDCQQVRLMSRSDAMDFYKKLGFCEIGAPIDVLGIPHQFMSLNLLFAQDKELS
ncbi:MAG: GNAT family N-acetyltransferase [Microcoleaceae cyanobacterium]